MSFELIGMILTQEASEIQAPSGPLVDAEFTSHYARVHEAAGFDRVLIGYGSNRADGWGVANHAVRATERLKFLLAHRPGFVAPTLTARQATTFDHLAGGGRLALHIITGGNEAEQRRDGDFLDHDTRYRRTAEYLQIIRRLWASPEPFDFDGEFYQLEKAFGPIRPATPEGIPLFFGGASEAAVGVGARYADVYMLWAEPLAAMRQRVEQAQAAAAALGRTLRFSVSVRPILAPTEARAWARAEEIAEQTLARRDQIRTVRPLNEDSSVGSLRLRQTAAAAEVHDTRLWTRVAAITGAQGNSTALVGTPEQVAEGLLAYVDLGIDAILIRGFNPVADATEYGRELIPLVRSEVARRERELSAAAAGPRNGATR
jgi:alkanesulfonate monooxygenase